MAVTAIPPATHNGQDNLPTDRTPDQTHSSPTLTSSSDSDEPHTLPNDDAAEDEADQMVGVSISNTQSRIKARMTPREEKNRIMERNGGYFETIPDNIGSDGVYLSEITAEPSTLPDNSSKPAVDHTPQEQEPAKDAGAESTTPTGADSDSQRLPKDQQRTSFTRSILKNGLPLRARAWSGGEAFKKFFPDFTSLAKRPTLPFGKNQLRPRSQTVKPSPSKLTLDQGEPSPPRSPRPVTSNGHDHDNDSDSNGASEEPISELKPVNGSAGAKYSFTRRPSTTHPGAPPMLRRSSSDQSLYLRTSSTASSLDQRPQYEHIHSQVNSRFKAIKDSLQDSSSRLLSMPTLHLNDIRSDWGYRPFVNDVSQRKGNNYSDEQMAPNEIPDTRVPRSNSNNTMHPVLTDAMAEMKGDVVVMGGYRGSILRSAKPPHRQLWVPMKVGLNIRKVDLEVGLNPEDEENMEETIIPSGVLSHVGPVDICRRLLKRLQKCENAMNGDLRVWDYGYDWRLSPHFLSRKLIQFLEGLPCNAPDVPREKRGAYVIAHSLGGLITRHAVNQRPDLFAGVVYAGVPQHCVNILGPLRNGDEVLLSSKVLTAQVNFTFRTSFALLPEDGHCFLDKRTKEEYRVDFFDAKNWDEWRLSPCINTALPPMTGKNFKDNLPLFTKRLSTVLTGKDSLSDETNDSSKSADTSSQHDYNSEHPPADTRRNAPKSTNPFSEVHNKASAMAPHIDGIVGPTANPKAPPPIKASTTSTIPRPAAMAYLERTLTEVKTFKQELAFNPSHQSENKYPPAAVLFGKTVPTVYGARVWSREQIKHQDAYDDLAFAAGDGVCLASAAMLPPGYRIIKDGLVKSDRGHVGLLGDLEGIGQCLRAIVRGRREGVGLGTVS